GVSPKGSGDTTGPPGAPSTAAASRIAASFSNRLMRQSAPRLRTIVPTGSSPRVDRCSTSPSGKRRRRIGGGGMATSLPRRRGVVVESRAGLSRAAVGPALDGLDVDENRSSPFGVRDLPETVLAPEQVAGDGQPVSLGRSDLEVAVRIPDLEDLGSHRTPPP